MKKPQLLISNKKKNKTRHQLKSLKRRNRKLKNLLKKLSLSKRLSLSKLKSLLLLKIL